MITSPFNRNGIPYFVLAGQVHNSSAYSLADLETAWKALSVLKANTAEVPVYWGQVEPQKGKFDFKHLDEIILAARERKLRLILLWFATWKNGSMQYAPEWVKSAPDVYRRVVTHAGNSLWVLSSHCEANWQADCAALSALLAHLKEFDGQKRTVAGLQIENEPGILGAQRDHSPEAEQEFAAPVPAELLEPLKQAASGPVRAAWLSAGSLKQGTWQQVFGPHAAEFFSAWSVARYIDRLAEAGKAAYNLPMYANVWLAENGWRQPGINYPSGGPVTGVLDLWKWAAPHLDLIAPDIYIDTPDTFREVCQAYARADNPLFIPESAGSLGSALNIFEAIARHRAVGYAVFGVESLLGQDGEVKPEAKALVESFQIVSNVQPLLLHFWGSDRIQAVIQREFQHEQVFNLGEYTILARFFNAGIGGWNHTDFRHAPLDRTQRGRGLVFADKGREFYIAGAGFSLQFRRRRSEQVEFSKAHDHFDAHLAPYLFVEEGHFGELGNFITDRTRNGDEIGSGIWVTPDVGVVRVKLAE